ncbi:MAG: hypothetical protein ACI4DV_04035 [Lachnospiraceae bacterium]
MKKKRVYSIGLSFLMAALVFAGLLLFEKSGQTPVVKKTVVCVKKDLPERMLLTEENLTEYLCLRQMDENCVSDAAGDTLESFAGKTVKVTLAEGTIVQKEWFTDMAALENRMREPVRFSVKSDDISRLAGGTFRSGDFADVYFYNEETGKSSLIFKGICIDEAFDSTGQTVVRGDTERVVSMVTLLLEEKDVEEFCERMENGSFCLARCRAREEVYEKCEEEIQVIQGEIHENTKE